MTTVKSLGQTLVGAIGNGAGQANLAANEETITCVHHGAVSAVDIDRWDASVFGLLP